MYNVHDILLLHLLVKVFAGITAQGMAVDAGDGAEEEPGLVDDRRSMPQPFITGTPGQTR
jgi:hypothetical protein